MTILRSRQKLNNFSIIRNKRGTFRMDGYGIFNRQHFYGNNVQREPDEWECEIDTVKDCSKAPKDDDLIVYIKPLVKRKIDLLMDKYKNREWLAYLFGEVGEQIIIEDMDVPKQRATAARVDEVEYKVPEGKRVIGVIHSHHSMGATFSGTDDTWINMNHDISILVAHTGIQSRVRWTAPCGAKKAVKAKVRLMLDVDMDAEKFLSDVESKLEEEAKRFVPRYSSMGGGFDDDDYQYTGHSWENKDVADNPADVSPILSLREALKADGIV